MMVAEKDPAVKKTLTVEEVFRKAELERRVQELVEKAVRDRASMLAGAKAEGKVEGMVEAKQDAVLRYLEKRFGDVICGDKIRRIKDVETLDRLFESLVDAGTLEEAEEVISRVLPQ